MPEAAAIAGVAAFGVPTVVGMGFGVSLAIAVAEGVNDAAAIVEVDSAVGVASGLSSPEQATTTPKMRATLTRALVRTRSATRFDRSVIVKSVPLVPRPRIAVYDANVGFEALRRFEPKRARPLRPIRVRRRPEL